MFKYPVVEIFESVQGEGVHQGEAAVFIRLAGCNLRCDWCDTDYTIPRLGVLTASEIRGMVNQSGARIAIITGGEPTLYPLLDLLTMLDKQCFTIHLETNGCYRHLIRAESDLLSWVAVSPKVSDGISCMMADEIKFVVGNEEQTRDMILMKRYEKIYPEGVVLHLQPCDPGGSEPYSERIKANLIYAESLQKGNPRWRISLQKHKQDGTR